MRTVMMVALLLCACGPRPARTICTPIGNSVMCQSVGPDRCHPDHATYQYDVRSGVCR